MPFPIPFLPALLIAALVAMAFPTYLWLVNRGHSPANRSLAEAEGPISNDSPQESISAEVAEFPPPSLGPDEAMLLARAKLRERGISLTNFYIDRVQFERSPQTGPKHWLITFLDNRYANDVPIKGGQTYVRVYLDRRVEVSFGE